MHLRILQPVCWVRGHDWQDHAIDSRSGYRTCRLCGMYPTVNSVSMEANRRRRTKGS